MNITEWIGRARALLAAGDVCLKQPDDPAGAMNVIGYTDGHGTAWLLPTTADLLVAGDWRARRSPFTLARELHGVGVALEDHPGLVNIPGVGEMRVITADLRGLIGLVERCPLCGAHLYPGHVAGIPDAFEVEGETFENWLGVCTDGHCPFYEAVTVRAGCGLESAVAVTRWPDVPGDVSGEAQSPSEAAPTEETVAAVEEGMAA